MLLLHNWDNNYLFCSRTCHFNRLGFAMLTRNADIVHWLHFDYICSQIVQCPGKAKIESIEKYSVAKT